jgi:hypothetical protein
VFQSHIAVGPCLHRNRSLIFAQSNFSSYVKSSHCEYVSCKDSSIIPLAGSVVVKIIIADETTAGTATMTNGHRHPNAGPGCHNEKLSDIDSKANCINLCRKKRTQKNGFQTTHLQNPRQAVQGPCQLPLQFGPSLQRPIVHSHRKGLQSVRKSTAGSLPVKCPSKSAGPRAAKSWSPNR